METKRKRHKVKGVTKIADLKKKINDEKYLETAISSMATHISRVFFN